MAKQRIHPFQHAIGYSVFQLIGFVVNHRPVEAEDFDQEHFEQPVATKNVQGQLFAAVGEANTASRLVLHQAGIGQGFDHRSGGAGHDVHRGCQFSHRDHLPSTCALLEVKVLQIIFDGTGGHGCGSEFGMLSISRGETQNESRARIRKRAEITLDAVSIANAKLDVVLGIKPGGWIERITFDENAAHGIKGRKSLI